jgi:hypothetical protein
VLLVVRGVVETVVLHLLSRDSRLLAGSPNVGEEPVYAFNPQASANRLWSSRFRRHPGATIRPEGGRLLHRYGEVVGRGAGGFQPDEEGEHAGTRTSRAP